MVEIKSYIDGLTGTQYGIYKISKRKNKMNLITTRHTKHQTANDENCFLTKFQYNFSNFWFYSTKNYR